VESRVGIFGGSFDPVHSGHVQTVQSFLNSGLLDRVLILLTPNPPHKQNHRPAGYRHRFEMLKLAFEHTENTEISEIEKVLPAPSYTLQTIEYLQKKNPDTLFYLCLGEDSLCQFHQWFNYKQILEKVNLIVAERPGFDSSSIEPQILEHVIFVDHKPIAVSSTDFRKYPGRHDEILPEKVAEYIRAHNLYQNKQG
jgi:nicotinate-nucleotide adenylyltransferase